MARKLQEITDWPERAATACYSAGTLANQCGVSVRTLERHIRHQFGLRVQEWLTELLMQRARRWLQQSHSVKAVALELGYELPHNFSRDFKKHTGMTPSQFQRGAQAAHV